MILFTLAGIALLFALVPALVYLRNTRYFKLPPPDPAHASLSEISVLIPARNEEAAIGAAVEAVLGSHGVRLEVIVLDDHSTDGTAAIVHKLVQQDVRVRLEPSLPLPPGWAGKQHACWQLANHARYPLLAFLDADVRLEPDALARMVAFLHTSKADLVSGFPRQETGTFLERLLIPLIHFVLLGYLPLWRMRAGTAPAYAAGCGQFFLTTREAYVWTGGHSAVKDSFHDGITLPRAYRRAGMMTDVCDATSLATCRMYRSAHEAWNGLAKNAREGLAAPKLIVFTTMMLLCGQVLPVMLLGFAAEMSPAALAITFAAIAASYYPRFDSVWRFHQPWLGAALHPLGTALLLAIQWYATFRAWIGRPVGWKGRPALTRPVLPPPPGPPSP